MYSVGLSTRTSGLVGLHTHLSIEIGKRLKDRFSESTIVFSILKFQYHILEPLMFSFYFCFVFYSLQQYKLYSSRKNLPRRINVIEYGCLFAGNFLGKKQKFQFTGKILLDYALVFLKSPLSTIINRKVY